MIDSCKKVILLGGGVMAERLSAQIELEGLELVGVADTLSLNDRSKKEFMGYKVSNLRDFENIIRKKEAAVILAINAFNSFDAIRYYLEVCKFPEEMLYVPNPYTTLRPCVMNDEFAAEKRILLTDDRYNKVSDLLKDDLSKTIFRLLVTSKQYDCADDFFELLPYSQIKEMYWCSEDYWQSYEFESCDKKQEATVIDCGAYIGDSIVPLCHKIPEKKVCYYAFEPETENAAIIKNNADYLKVCEELYIMQYGVGNQDKKMYFELPQNKQKDAGRFVDSSTGNGETALEIRRLDSLELDVRGTVYIKMDIEGSELAALEGAAGLIRRNRPYMAICIYHRKNDLINIPLYIKSLVSEYSFYLRGGFHTILWAIPPKK